MAENIAKTFFRHCKLLHIQKFTNIWSASGLIVECKLYNLGQTFWVSSLKILKIVGWSFDTFLSIHFSRTGIAQSCLQATSPSHFHIFPQLLHWAEFWALWWQRQHIDFAVLLMECRGSLLSSSFLRHLAANIKWFDIIWWQIIDQMMSPKTKALIECLEGVLYLTLYIRKKIESWTQATFYSSVSVKRGHYVALSDVIYCMSSLVMEKWNAARIGIVSKEIIVRVIYS